MTDIDWDRVFRYFGNECSADERVRFEQWLADDPQRRALVDAAVAAAGRTLESMPTGNPHRRVPAITRRHTAATRPAWLLPVAASVVVAVGATIMMKYPTWAARDRPAPAAELRVAQTVHGGRQALRLSDGTRVVLGPASSLRYPAAFGAASRDVELTGEGFFEVTHDSAHPFRVHAAHAAAEDVGTSFAVRAYPEDSVVRVVVTEGSVSLGAATRGAVQGTLIGRGELGALAKNGAAARVERVNTAAYLGWLDGRLVFDETPLDEVVAQLGRWYDAPFRIADPSLGARTLTASFTTESLHEVLSSLAPVLDVRFDRVKDTIVVRAARR